MKRYTRQTLRLIASGLLAAATPLAADPALPPASPAWHTQYLRLSVRQADALLYVPADKAPLSPIAFVYLHPNGDTFAEPLGPQMAQRGHRVLMIDYHGAGVSEDDDQIYAASISAGISLLRGLPGVEKVLLVGHSGGGHVAAFYANVAENGPAACSGPDKLYPCNPAVVSDLARPDGLVLLDPTLGALHQANALDPALREDGSRDEALDMFSPANGYVPQDGSAHYSAAFIARFDAAQRARSERLTNDALTTLKAVEAGKAPWSDDAPLIIPGMGNLAAGARLFQPDTGLLAHTHGTYSTIRADGSHSTGPIVSVRPPMGELSRKGLGTVGEMTRITTVRGYLASSAIRLNPDFAIGKDVITGVDWGSAYTSTPGNARGITVPTLLLTMTCHYLVVPDETIFQNLAARDKTFIGIDGATHVFKPCRPEYGDTLGRVFQTVEDWSTKPGRF